MKISMRKLSTLCKRDFYDFCRNPAIFISILVPVLFVIFYKSLNLPFDHVSQPAFLLNIGTLMNCCMCGLLIASTTIAEEKEKFTLRTLMLSNISGIEFLISKLTLGFTITMLGNLIIYLLSGNPISNMPGYLMGTVLGCIAVNLISAVMGIVSRDQASCSILQIPVMMLFLLPPMFSEMNAALRFIARLTPLNAAMSIYYAYTAEGKLFNGNAAYHYLVLLCWIVGSALIFVLVYRKRGLDN